MYKIISFLVAYFFVLMISSNSYAIFSSPPSYNLTFPGVISGTIVDGVSGSPISGALVKISIDNVTQSDLDGYFYYSISPPGNYSLTVLASNYYPYSTNVYAHSFMTKTQLEIKLRPNSSEMNVSVSDQVVYPSIKQVTVPLAITSTINESFYTITAFSANQSMISDDHIEIESLGANPHLIITPNEHKYGTTPIYITVSNGIETIVKNFDLTVRYPQFSFRYIDSTNHEIDPVLQATDSSGFLYQSDTAGNCIKKFLNYGYFGSELIHQWGQPGNDYGNFNQPMGIAVDDSGFIYVVDSGNNRIQVFTPYGEFITSFGEFGSEKLSTPEYIHIDESGDIYITERDKENTKVFKQINYTEGITKAIIVVGGGNYEVNGYLQGTINCANLAYNALTHQGLDNNQIQYLSSEIDNQKVDDIPTIENIKNSITHWAKGADSLVINLVAHIREGYFRANDYERLSITVLNNWLDETQKEIPGKLIVINDTVYTGSFISYLSKQVFNRERIIISGTPTTYNFMALFNGSKSLSSFFWSEIFNGQDIKNAFEKTKGLKECIESVFQININGNDIYNENIDIESVSNVFIGNGHYQQSGLPLISEISPVQTITANSSAVITATGVWAKDGIQTVFAHIIPTNPDEIDISVNNIPDIELEYEKESKQFKGIYNQFLKEGIYLIEVYARDINGILSRPMRTKAFVGTSINRRAIILMGKSSHSSIGNLAYESIKYLQYSDDEISLLKGETATIHDLRSTLYECVSSNTKDIVLYMMIDGDNTNIFLNDGENLSNNELGSIIYEIQENNDIFITIVCDAPFSEKYLKDLMPFIEINRVLIVRPVLNFNDCDGKMPFSYFFWNSILMSNSLFSYEQLTDIIRGSELLKKYQIDRWRYNDATFIESVSSHQTLHGETSTIIEANNVTFNHDIFKRVEAIIYSPGQENVINKTIKLQNIPGSNNYSAIYDNFSIYGEYKILISAIGISGYPSFQRLTTVFQTVFSNQTIYSSIDQPEFTVSLKPFFSEVSINDITVSVHSGDLSLIPDENISIDMIDIEKFIINIKLQKHKYGTTPIHISVSDGDTSINEQFDLSIKIPQISYQRTDDTAISISALTQTKDNDGFTYKSDTQHNCIKKYSNNELIAQWGQFGHDNGFFDKPMGIAVDSAGLIYVVDSGNCRIQVFTPYGEFLTSFNEYGTIRKRKKFTPKYIKIDKNDTIYISENIDHTSVTTFQKYDYTEGITKAIIVAGGGDYEGNHIKEPINFCTNLAYNTLDSQGFDNNTIYLLSDDTDNANVDALPTLETIEYAITEWPKDADSLVIYFVDHGSTGTFGVNKEGQVLSATVLNQWLDKIQKDIPGKLIVVMESCYSGSFIPYISKPSKNRERIVITSTSDNETAQFLSNGIISFSSFFWRSIFNGKDILQAFETAKESIHCITEHTALSQHYQLNANGNEIPNEKNDYNLVQNVLIGNGECMDNKKPKIYEISPVQKLADSSSATITATGVWANDGIKSVWVQIIPASYTLCGIDKPLSEFPPIEMTPVNEGEYELVYDNFTLEGTYLIIVFAEDIDGYQSDLKLTKVIRDNPLNRQAIIVLGDPVTNSYTGMIDNGRNIYRILGTQGYFPEDIQIISNKALAEGKSYSPASLENLRQSIIYLKDSDAQDVILCLLGNGDANDFYINESEKISKNELDNWLNSVQRTNNIHFTVIYDAPNAYDFISQLIPSETTGYENKRIIISATSKNQTTYDWLNGQLSFSYYLWDGILCAQTLDNAFDNADASLSTLQRRKQKPTIVYGRDKAKTFKIGYGVLIADDKPFIRAVSKNQVLNCENVAKIMAFNVTSMNEVEKVIAVIYPPIPLNYNVTMPANEISMIELLNHPGTNNYSGAYHNFSTFGEYEIVICAIDKTGALSNPLKTKVLQTHGIKGMMSSLQTITEIEINPMNTIIDVNGDNRLGMEDIIFMLKSGL
jgi:hypothetical protein